MGRIARMVNLQIFMRIILLTIVCFIVGSCRPKFKEDPCFSTFNDFENTLGWVDNTCNSSGSATQRFGKDSKGSIHVSNKFPYGYMFRAKFSELSNEPIFRAEVNASCKKNSPAIDSCGLVCSVENNAGQILYWQELNLKEFINETDWFDVNKKFDLSAFSGSENKVNVFVWNHSSAQDIFIDNVSIKFYSVPE